MKFYTQNATKSVVSDYGEGKRKVSLSVRNRPEAKDGAHLGCLGRVLRRYRGYLSGVEDTRREHGRRSGSFKRVESPHLIVTVNVVEAIAEQLNEVTRHSSQD